LSRTGVPGWETGTTAVSQPGQINVFAVVSPIPPKLAMTIEILNQIVGGNTRVGPN